PKHTHIHTHEYMLTHSLIHARTPACTHTQLKKASFQACFVVIGQFSVFPCPTIRLIPLPVSKIRYSIKSVYNCKIIHGLSADTHLRQSVKSVRACVCACVSVCVSVCVCVCVSVCVCVCVSVGGGHTLLPTATSVCACLHA